MNRFTQAAWDVINEAIVDDEALLEELKKLLLKEYAPFLSTEQGFQVNITALQASFLDKFKQWYEWLPSTAIHIMYGELAQEAFQEVDWNNIAGRLQKQFVPASEEKRQLCRR